MWQGRGSSMLCLSRSAFGQKVSASCQTPSRPVTHCLQLLSAISKICSSSTIEWMQDKPIALKFVLYHGKYTNPNFFLSLHLWSLNIGFLLKQVSGSFEQAVNRASPPLCPPWLVSRRAMKSNVACKPEVSWNTSPHCAYFPQQSHSSAVDDDRCSWKGVLLWQIIRIQRMSELSFLWFCALLFSPWNPHWMETGQVELEIGKSIIWEAQTFYRLISFEDCALSRVEWGVQLEDRGSLFLGATSDGTLLREKCPPRD